MLKDIMKKVIMSLILYFLFFFSLHEADYLASYVFDFMRNHTELFTTFSFYIVVCIQALIWLCKPLKSKKITIICMFISFACIVYAFRFLVL